MVNWDMTIKCLDEEQRELEKFDIWETIEVLKYNYISVKIDYIENYWYHGQGLNHIERNYVVRVLNRVLSLGEAQKLAQELIKLDRVD